MHIYEIRQKSQKFLYKYNKLMLSKLKRLCTCGWNRKMCGVQ